MAITRPPADSRPLELIDSRVDVNHRQALIEVKNASKQFGKDKMVVHGLNFEVQPGQIFCLLGASGSGKSTTMRLLTGLYKPSEGDVRVFGAEPFRFKKSQRERIGYMPQQFVLFPELSVWGNISFVASVYGMSWFGRRPKIRKALEFVDLWDSRNKLASQLSGGMQRRLELAATLVHNPSLIFVDEPTAGIDPILRAKFWEHFRELRDEGRTIFVTTQYVTEADYCDRVAILNRGRVLALGAPEDIRRAAFGGETINLSLEAVTTQAIRILQGVAGIKFIRFLSAEELQLTADNAGISLPLVIAALQEANITVTTIEQYRPDFEEVFVALMEQDQPEEEENPAHKDDKNSSKEGRQAEQQSNRKPRKAGIAGNQPTAQAQPELMQKMQEVLHSEEPRPPMPENPTLPGPDTFPSPGPVMPEPTPQVITPPPPILPDSQVAGSEGYTTPPIAELSQMTEPLRVAPRSADVLDETISHNN